MESSKPSCAGTPSFESENRVTVTGTVVRSPQVGRTNSGDAAASVLLHIGCTDRPSLRIRVNAFDDVAEIVAGLREGLRVRVEAALMQRTTRGGVAVVELKAYDVRLLT